MKKYFGDILQNVGESYFLSGMFPYYPYTLYTSYYEAILYNASIQT